MQEKHGKDGLVIITMSADPATDKALAQGCAKDIAKHKALPHNYIFGGGAGDLFGKLKADGPPVAFVFDRDNRWVKRLPEPGKEDWEYPELDKLVEPLLKKRGPG